MKKYFLLIVIPILAAGLREPKSKKIVVPECLCETNIIMDSRDTVNPDSAKTIDLPDSIKVLVKQITVPVVRKTIDSFRKVQQCKIDSVKSVRDSLKTEIHRLKRKHKLHI